MPLDVLSLPYYRCGLSQIIQGKVGDAKPADTCLDLFGFPRFPLPAKFYLKEQKTCHCKEWLERANISNYIVQSDVHIDLIKAN